MLVQNLFYNVLQNIIIQKPKKVKSDNADRQKKFYLLKGQRLCLLTMYRLQRVGEWISVYCEKGSDLMKVLILAAIFQLWY